MKRIKEETQEESDQEERGMRETSRKEGVEKRKRAKKVDKQARWAGLIMLVVIMLVGFLMWVTGEVKNKTVSEIIPRENQKVQRQESGASEKVIVR